MGGSALGPDQVFWVAQEDEPSASPFHTCPEVSMNLSPAEYLSQGFFVTAEAGSGGV